LNQAAVVEEEQARPDKHSQDMDECLYSLDSDAMMSARVADSSRHLNQEEVEEDDARAGPANGVTPGAPTLHIEKVKAPAS
jgi:hypothetical protein